VIIPELQLFEIQREAHLQVPVAAEHEAVAASELIGIDHTASTDLLDGELQQRGGRDVRNDTDMNVALTLQDAEERHFAGRSPAPVAFAPAPEVGRCTLIFVEIERPDIFLLR
jgi:hypothetical protein